LLLLSRFALQNSQRKQPANPCQIGGLFEGSSHPSF